MTERVSVGPRCVSIIFILTLFGINSSNQGRMSMLPSAGAEWLYNKMLRFADAARKTHLISIWQVFVGEYCNDFTDSRVY